MTPPLTVAELPPPPSPDAAWDWSATAAAHRARGLVPPARRYPDTDITDLPDIDQWKDSPCS